MFSGECQCEWTILRQVMRKELLSETIITKGGLHKQTFLISFHSFQHEDKLLLNKFESQCGQSLVVFNKAISYYCSCKSCSLFQKDVWFMIFAWWTIRPAEKHSHKLTLKSSRDQNNRSPSKTTHVSTQQRPDNIIKICFLKSHAVAEIAYWVGNLN